MALLLKEHIASSRKLPSNEDLLIARAGLLAERDRILIQAVFIHNQNADAIARLLGQPGHLVRHRVHNLMKRMAGQRFMDAARALPYLRPFDAELARAKYCEGASFRLLCRRFGLSRYQLQRQLDHVTGQIITLRRQHRDRASLEQAFLDQMDPSGDLATLGCPQRGNRAPASGEDLI